MIALGTRDRSAWGAAIRRQYIQWMIYLLIFGLVIPANVDNAAHLGGLAGGFVVAYLAGTPGFSEGAENFWRLAAGVSSGDHRVGVLRDVHAPDLDRRLSAGYPLPIS